MILYIMYITYLLYYIIVHVHGHGMTRPDDDLLSKTIVNSGHDRGSLPARIIIYADRYITYNIMPYTLCVGV